MFAHPCARESEYSEKQIRDQKYDLANSLAVVENRVRQSGRVLIKRYANNELRITFGGEGEVVPRQGSEAGVAACLDAAEAALVYSAKVQHGDEISEFEPKRPRPAILTRYAAHRIREAAAVIDAEYGLSSYFNTLTLPGSTREALDTAALHSTGILNAYMQRLRHEWNKRVSDKTDFMACGVWEWQKRGALHFHLLIGIKDEAIAAFFEANHQRWWRQVLQTYSKKTGVDLFERSDGKTWRNYVDKPRTEWAKVRKSVGRYMSKYISKSAREAKTEGWTRPAAWSYMSEDAWEKVKAERRLVALRLISRVEADRVAHVLADVAQTAGAKLFPMENPFTGQLCGYVAFFDNDKKDECFQAMLEYISPEEDEPCRCPKHTYGEIPEYAYPDAGRVLANLIFDGMTLDVVA